MARFCRGGLAQQFLSDRLLELLEVREAFRLLRVSRFTPIRDFHEAGGAVIIIPDVFGLFRFERLDIEKDTGIIEELSRKNFIIMTASTPVLAEVLRETRLEEWELMHHARLSLDVESYNSESRWSMVEHHLQRAREQGRIQPIREQWLKDTLKAFRPEALNNSLRLPLEIRRLVDDRLPQISDAKDVPTAIREVSNLQSEIGKWFLELSPNDQCFLFTLALFDGFERSELWQWYDLISDRLRRLNRELSTLPLQVVGSHLAPYVIIRDGKPSFGHPSFHEAVLKVVADAYREYFLRLIPDFIKVSIPSAEGGKEEESTKSQAVREALSLAVGELARNGIADLMELIEKWASFKTGKVRMAACEALSRCIENPTQIETLLDLLNDWSHNRTHENYGCRWTAAVTLGRLALVAPEQTIAGLNYLAGDPNPFVRSGVPKALRSLSEVRPTESQKVFTNLASDPDPFTRREVSRVLKTLSYRRYEWVSDLLKKWSSLESANRSWTLVRTCLILPRAFQKENLEILSRSKFHSIGGVVA
jgi:hypothetical protein